MLNKLSKKELIKYNYDLMDGIKKLIETCERRQEQVNECLKMIDKYSLMIDELSFMHIQTRLDELLYLRKLTIKVRMNVRRQFARTYWDTHNSYRYEFKKYLPNFIKLEYKATNNARIQIRQVVRHSVPYRFIEQVSKEIRGFKNDKIPKYKELQKS